jgi:hypothetical protein
VGNHNPRETRVHQDRKLTKYGKPEMRYGMLDMHKKPEVRAVMIDANIGFVLRVEHDRVDNVTNAVRLGMGNEVSIKVYQGRELIMHEEPETRIMMVDTTEAVRIDMKYEDSIKNYQGRRLIMRDVMRKTNSKSVIKSLGEVAFENILDRVFDKHGGEKPGMRAVMDDIFDATTLNMKHKIKYDVNNAVKTQSYEINSKPMIKALGETVFENTQGKTSGKHRVHEKPGIRAVTGDIIDAIMDEKPGPRYGTLKTKHKNLNVDSIDAIRLDKKYEADINMFKEAETRMLKTNLR